MNEEKLTQIADQLRALWEMHVPSQYHPPAVPAALIVLALGIGVAVLGARVARSGMTLVMAGLGGLAAWVFRYDLDWSPGAVLAAGMAGGALIGFVLFRLWVGLAAGVLLCGLALGVYGNRHIVPHFVEYDSTHNFTGAFSIPEAPASENQSLERFEAWWRDFWLYVQSRESDVNVWVAGIALGAAVVGLILGAVLPRLTLILGCAGIGTALVMAGFAALAKHSNAELYQAALDNPRIIGLVTLVLLGTSLVLQTLLTRRPVQAAAPSAVAT